MDEIQSPEVESSRDGGGKALVDVGGVLTWEVGGVYSTPKQ
jgi:hypothetical protein